MIGGPGARAILVIQGLVHDKAFTVRVLARDPESVRSKGIEALGNVELVHGN
jgi:hypothetical protein